MELADLIQKCKSFEPGDEFGLLLEEGLTVLRRTQKELAFKLGVTPATVFRWISGQYLPDAAHQTYAVRGIHRMALSALHGE